MKFRTREPEKLRGPLSDALAAVRSDSRSRTVVKAALIAGGAAVLTAGSAAISSFRRRTEPDS
jgi:hypothetical protein